MPPSPSGSLTLGFGPATKPSVDIEMSNLSFCMGASSGVRIERVFGGAQT
jgi:hypothetical protein